MTNKIDVLRDHSGETRRKYGKNFKSLVGAGSWVIDGFHYGSDRCGCCGRPISRILRLRNESHEAVCKTESYQFNEIVNIGIVCGPRVFIESCIGFYEDPTREWERQWKAWKGYVEYVILGAKTKELWDLVPTELRSPVDEYLERTYIEEKHTGTWWILRDAKKSYMQMCERVLKQKETPNARTFNYSCSRVVYAAKRLNLIPMNWELTEDFKIDKHEVAA